jgi:hypothetical protein
MQGKYPGVYWHPRLKRWIVQVVVFVGAFEDQDEAGAVRGRLDREDDQIQRFVRRVALGKSAVRHD